MSIEQISDTARWMAYVRAVESERPDALFHDTFARRLAGDAGEAIAREIGSVDLITRGIASRTAVLDELILATIRQNPIDLVLNLAAGLDTRPWRLPLPGNLRWVDVDLPHVLEFKADVIGPERARCEYESLTANVVDADAQARVIQHCHGARQVLVVTEGFLVYLSPSQVTALARTLRKEGSIKWWLTDLIGPRALEMLRQVWGPGFPGAKFQFGPADSVEFFGRLGWREASLRSMREEDKRLNRATKAPVLGRMMLWLASENFREEMRRLSVVALLQRDQV
jgi:methyltransferase (TIGR00027 family)